MSLHPRHHQDPCDWSSFATFVVNLHWGRAATGKKKKKSKALCLCMQGRFCHIQLSATLWTVACQSSLSGGFSGQEYWSTLANTGCHTPLERSISCCLSHQLPWVPGSARTPATQATTPPPHLALTGSDSSSLGQPQEQTPGTAQMQRWK